MDCGDEWNETDEDGNKVPRGIICGAPNMKAGEKVVVTLPGAVLPGDFKIEPRKTYGHISNGMCASERELGLGDNRNGIILLRQYGFSEAESRLVKPGQAPCTCCTSTSLCLRSTSPGPWLHAVLPWRRPANTTTPPVPPTPIRPWHSTRRPRNLLTTSPAPRWTSMLKSTITIRFTACPVATATTRVSSRTSIPTPTRPTRTRDRRLIRAGMRSISLAVDVTNYVMLDLGQPMHAYDLDKLEGPIVVRRANEGEKLTTLDGKEHDLSVEDLLITDSPNGERGSRILGLAGVMGGLYGEVTADTKNILLEAAHFDQVTIARSARRHKIPSEASRRFERGVDTALQPAATQMAAELMAKYGNGEPSEHPNDVNNTPRAKAIHFKASEVARVAGLDVDINRISDILTDIGCTVAGGGNGEFAVTAPSWRPDLNEPCDLVEEIARLVGYDQIPITVPPAPVEGLVGLTPDQQRRRRVADELAEFGMVESLSYPFVGDDDYKAFGFDPEATKKVSVEIANPLYGDRPYLRREILPTLATTVQRNIRRGIENVSLYELGHVYLWNPDAPAIPALPGGVKPTEEQLKALDAGLPDQPDHVAGIFTGLSENTGWMGGKRPVDWSDAVEAVHRIADRIGAAIELSQPAAEEVPAQWHPGRFAYVDVDGKHVGLVGELHPHVNEALGFPAHSAAFELNLTALFATLSGKPVQAKPISTFPPVKQDLAFTVSTDVTAAELEKTIVEAAGNSLESIDLFDVYTGDQLGEGLKSLAYAVTFRAEDKTLTSEDSEAIRKRIVDAAAKLGAQLRA